MKFKRVLFAWWKEKRSGCQKAAAKLSLRWEWEPTEGALSLGAAGAGELEQKAAVQGAWLLRTGGELEEVLA